MVRPCPSPILGLLLLLTLFLAACHEGGQESFLVPEAAELEAGAAVLGVEWAGEAGAVGSLVVIAPALVEHPAAGTVAAFQGSLRFDPERLAYVGQLPGGHMAVANVQEADQGRIRFAALDVEGLEGPLAHYVFRTLSADFTVGLGVEVEILAGMEQELLEWTGQPGVFRSQRLPAPEGARALGIQEWAAHLRALEGDDPTPAPQPVPGQGNVFGDVNLDGSIDVLDGLWTAGASVGNNEIILGTDLPARDAQAANVRPANLPGLGEPSDPCPPGTDVCGSDRRTIDVLDALAIAQESVGIDQVVVGEPIPRATAGDTVFLSGPITTSRTLSADSAYVLVGTVRVQGGGVLTIPAGTRVLGEIGSLLLVERDGTLEVDGTGFDPVIFTCREAAPTRGCWGGVVILGNAPVGRGTPTSPAAPGTGAAGCLEILDDPRDGAYGGCDAADSRGSLRYARVEFATRGLTLLGVGAGTEVDFIQVHGSASGGTTVAGGTVDLRHLMVTATGGDALGWRDGWRGRGQYLVLQLDPAGGSSGLAGVDRSGAVLASEPVLYNSTVVSLAPTGVPGTAVRLADGSGADIRNLLVLGTAVGLDVDGSSCSQIPGALQLRSSVFAGVANPGDPDPDATCAAGDGAEAALLLEPGSGNSVVTDPLAVSSLLKGALDPFLPDFRATLGGAASIPGEAPPAGGFFDVSATFVGGFPVATAATPHLPWYSGWSRGGLETDAPFGSVEGTVTAIGGGSVDGLVVWTELGELAGVTDASGAFKIPLVRPGSGSLFVTGFAAPCVDPGATPVTVVAGASTPVAVTLDCSPPPANAVFELGSDAEGAAFVADSLFDGYAVAELRWGYNQQETRSWELGVRPDGSFANRAQGEILWEADPQALEVAWSPVSDTLFLAVVGSTPAKTDSIAGFVGDLVTDDPNALLIRARAGTGNTADLVLTVTLTQGGEVVLAAAPLIGDPDGQYWVILDDRLAGGFTIQGTVDFDSPGNAGSDPAVQITLGRTP